MSNNDRRDGQSIVKLAAQVHHAVMWLIVSGKTLRKRKRRKSALLVTCRLPAVTRCAAVKSAFSWQLGHGQCVKCAEESAVLPFRTPHRYITSVWRKRGSSTSRPVWELRILFLFDALRALRIQFYLAMKIMILERDFYTETYYYYSSSSPISTPKN